MTIETDTIPEDSIRLKRACEPPDDRDGVRVLVDRLWARGISKEEAHLDAWMKELGPSDELRAWFGHRHERWNGFQERYRHELTDPLRQMLLTELQSVARTSTLTLVYGARDTTENEAVVLREYLLNDRPEFSGRQDDAVVLLVTAAATAAGHVDDAVPASTLRLFAAPLLTGGEFEAAVQILHEGADLHPTPHGWQLTSRGRRHARGLS